MSGANRATHEPSLASRLGPSGFDPGQGDHPWFPLAEMREAYDELNGCSIRRPGATCEVRKEFLAVALFVLSEAIATQTTKKGEQ